MKNSENKANKRAKKNNVKSVTEPTVNIAPNKPLEKEDDTNVQNIADSVIIAFFLALIIKVGLWIWSIYYPVNEENEDF
jgi:hypothetical protein